MSLCTCVCAWAPLCASGSVHPVGTYLGALVGSVCTLMCACLSMCAHARTSLCTHPPRSPTKVRHTRPGPREDGTLGGPRGQRRAPRRVWWVTLLGISLIGPKRRPSRSLRGPGRPPEVQRTDSQVCTGAHERTHTHSEARTPCRGRALAWSLRDSWPHAQDVSRQAVRDVTNPPPPARGPLPTA